MPTQQRTRNVLREIKCPHCWESFPSEDIHYISIHSSLTGDDRLGENEMRRFLPDRFNVQGLAIDARGEVCVEFGCPNCHLTIARDLVNLKSWITSIVGAPSCGKTFFLTSMVHCLKDSFTDFHISFESADNQTNKMLLDWENILFSTTTPDQLVTLEKSELPGATPGYNQVQYGVESRTYPRPFLYSLNVTDKHRHSKSKHNLSRVICMYDNSGESFGIDTDDATAPVTRHMASAEVLFFCFDPTQDGSWRPDLKFLTNDIQVQEETVTSVQYVVFTEMLERIRKYRQMGQNDTHEKPLVIIVTKFDAWQGLYERDGGPPLSRKPWKTSGGSARLDLTEIDRVSDHVREMLRSRSPSFVQTAERFSKQVLYVPVSATGTSPDASYQFRPEQLQPLWCEVPLLAALAKWRKGFIFS